MPSVEELLNQDSEDETNLEAYEDIGIEYCTVDDDTRLVTIPDKYKKLGVESDAKAKRIWFRFPKLVGNNGVDLSAIGVRVNFRNANGEGDIYIVEDLTTDGDYVTFSWELTRKVTAYKGNVSFVVCAVKSATDGTIKNEWNTTLNKECEVLEGLEVTEQIEQENPDIIEYILANLGGSVSAEQIAQAVEAYMKEHPFTETDPTVPEKLPNPNPLTFTGAVTGSYDGSEAVNIDIPISSGGGDEKKVIYNQVLTENVGFVSVPFSEFSGCKRIICKIYIPKTEEETYKNYLIRIKLADTETWSYGTIFAYSKDISANTNHLLLMCSMFIVNEKAHFENMFYMDQYTKNPNNLINASSLRNLGYHLTTQSTSIYFEIDNRTYLLPIGTEITILGY